VGLSLGGFAYMAVSLGYVGIMMLLMARPLMGYFLRIVGVMDENVATISPIVIALTLSVLLSVVSLLTAERRLTGVAETD
jgi:hypothetical protein